MLPPRIAETLAHGVRPLALASGSGYRVAMVDRDAMARAHAIFDPITDRLCALPDVDMGRMFGTEGVRVRGKVFAFVAHEGALVVKLPEQRIGELTADGVGAPMIMRGRPLREWAEISPDAAETWAALIDEAHRFVDAITP